MKPGAAAIHRIWSGADDYETYDFDRFKEEFASDLSSMEKRCLFLVSPDGQDIGTATAWVEEDWFQEAPRLWARLHWIAIVPEFQGRGLAKPMLSAVMNLSKGFAFARALLYTESVRLPAIELCLDFGFVPNLSYPEGESAWALISAAMEYPRLQSLID